MDGLCDGVVEGLGDSMPMKENDGIGEIRRDEYTGVVDGKHVVEEAEGDPLSSAGVKRGTEMVGLCDGDEETVWDDEEIEALGDGVVEEFEEVLPLISSEVDGVADW